MLSELFHSYMHINLLTVLLIFSGHKFCFGLHDFRYKSFGCQVDFIPGFEDIKPLRLLAASVERSSIGCIKARGERPEPAHFPVFVLVYRTVDNETAWQCRLLTAMAPTLQVFEIGSDLTNPALTPVCHLYFPQGQSCDSLEGQGQSLSWINLWPEHPGVMAVCDFAIDGGGWTVVQRRKDGSEDFHRGWQDYKLGFGSPEGEFWFGLEKMRAMVVSKPHQIRFEMRKANGDERYAVYQDFWFDDESSKYRMTVGAYSGTAGDSFTFHQNSKFDAKDVQPRTPYTCPERFGGGGFWYHNCHNINPTGGYGLNGYGDGINWNLFTGYYESLVFIEMKLKPM